jgi:ABC-type dipeptide/oligopeptide/nickel transport system ATPase subunit
MKEYQEKTEPEKNEKRMIQAPFIKEELETLKAGDYIYITGTIYTARDAAHKRLYESMIKGEEIPISFENNIIYGRNIEKDKFEKVLEICNLKKLRDKNKLRNNFMIEENGFNISGGERQKIILARSILNDFNYLILDESLSEVGYKEEKEIIGKLFDCFKEKTIIYISHKKEIIDMFEEKYKMKGVGHNYKSRII